VRRCVFFGTTNKPNFLQNDNYGNRRFIVFKTHKEQIKKTVFEDLQEDEVLQLWAEVYYYYKQGMSTLLSKELQQSANDIQEEMQEVDIVEQIINEKLEVEVPQGFEILQDEQRRNYYDTGIIYDNAGITFSNMHKRNFFTTMDIYNDFLQNKIKSYNKNLGGKINAIMRKNKNFNFIDTHINGERKRGFERILQDDVKIQLAKTPKDDFVLTYQEEEETAF
jgi:putative DNA primase/helicase